MADFAAPAADALDLLLARASVHPRLLREPGPDDATIGRAVAAACRAPDHGGLRPWRFLVFRGEARHELGRLRAEALKARDPGVGPEVLETEHAKAVRAPVVIATIALVRPGHKIPAWEQAASAAAATMNLINALELMGWGAFWSSGWSTEDAAVKRALGLAEHDALLGFVQVGTAAERTSVNRPDAAGFWRAWDGAAPSWRG